MSDSTKFAPSMIVPAVLALVVVVDLGAAEQVVVPAWATSLLDSLVDRRVGAVIWKSWLLGELVLFLASAWSIARGVQVALVLWLLGALSFHVATLLFMGGESCGCFSSSLLASLPPGSVASVLALFLAIQVRFLVRANERIREPRRDSSLISPSQDLN